MKKTLAVILSLIMLVCCIPFSANAEETSGIPEVPATIAEDFRIEYSNQLLSDEAYTVEAGATLYINSGVTAYIPRGAMVTIKQGGRLICYGDLIVTDGAQLLVQGICVGSDRIVGNDDRHGSAVAEVRFPALASDGVELEGKIEVSYGYSKDKDAYADQKEGFVWNNVQPAGQTVTVPLDRYFFVKAHIIDPPDGTDKYDDALMDVYFNSEGMPFGQGSHSTLLGTAGDITYSQWTSDSKFLNTFNIYLPTGEGYTVYGREGEQTALGETVKLKYGQTFSFRVEIDPEYDMSVYEVYVFNGYGWTNLDPSNPDLAGIEPAKPDEYGYYTIKEIKGEHTIYVQGVVENSTIIMVGDILDMVKNIFEMITGFFAEILALLGISLGGAA